MRISEQTATFALYIIGLMVYMTVVGSVHCAVSIDSLYKADLRFFFKSLNNVFLFNINFIANFPLWDAPPLSFPPYLRHKTTHFTAYQSRIYLQRKSTRMNYVFHISVSIFI